MIDYQRIRAMDRDGEPSWEIARAVGCHPRTVRKVLRRDPDRDPEGWGQDPDYVSDAETLRRLNALVKRLEKEQKR